MLQSWVVDQVPDRPAAQLCVAIFDIAFFAEFFGTGAHAARRRACDVRTAVAIAREVPSMTQINEQ